MNAMIKAGYENKETLERRKENMQELDNRRLLKQIKTQNVLKS